MKGQTKGPGGILAGIVVSVTALLAGCATSLDQALQRNDTKTVDSLLRRGADPNVNDRYGRTPLVLAAAYGRADGVRLLLDHGANPNQKDNVGETPLVWAAKDGYTEVVGLLLAHRADPNGKDTSGGTPLVWAAAYGHSDVVKLLLDHGASPNQKSTIGETPLVWAAKEGYTEVVELLLAHKADPNRQDTSGHTPLYYAAHYGYIETVKTLLDHGARPTLADIQINALPGPLDTPKRRAINLIRVALHLPPWAAPVPPKTLHQQAREALVASNPLRALKIYMSILRTTPGAPPIAVSFNDYKDAIAISRKLKHVPPAPEAYRKEMVIALMLVREAKSQEDYTKVRDHFVAAAGLAPWMPMPYQGLGHVEEALKDYSASAQYFRLYLLAAPKASNSRAIRDHIYELSYKAGESQ